IAVTHTSTQAPTSNACERSTTGVQLYVYASTLPTIVAAGAGRAYPRPPPRVLRVERNRSAVRAHQLRLQLVLAQRRPDPLLPEAGHRLVRRLVAEPVRHPLPELLVALG